MDNFNKWIEQKEINQLENIISEMKIPIGAALGRTAVGLGQLGGRLSNTAISGLGKGVMSGLRRAGDVLKHGQSANHPSLQYKNVMNDLKNLMDDLEKEKQPSLYNALKQSYEALANAYSKNKKWRPPKNPIIKGIEI